MTSPGLSYPGVGYCGACRILLAVDDATTACNFCGSAPTHYTPFDFGLATNGSEAEQLAGPPLVVDDQERDYGVKCPHCDGDVTIRVTASSVGVVSGEAPGKEQTSVDSDEDVPADAPASGGLPAEEAPQA